MLAHTVRQIAAAVPVMLLVALMVFSLLYLAPDDPAAIIAGDQATPAEIERIRIRWVSTSHSSCVSSNGWRMWPGVIWERRSSRTCL